MQFHLLCDKHAVYVGLRATQGAAIAGIKVFKFVRAGNAGQWQVVTSHGRPRFYDVNEDKDTNKHDWNLEVCACMACLQHGPVSVFHQLLFSSPGLC